MRPRLRLPTSPPLTFAAVTTTIWGNPQPAARHHPTMDDPTLVRRARGGDRAAFARLVDRHSALLRATTRRAAPDEHLAADAAQEAVLTAMLSLDRLRDDAAFGPWLAGIGLNATRHLLRDRREAPR